ncbi:VapC toxin family PIN domain ribonuclease [Candidatus Poribacteria bacterium]|nr:MAG: VapC toxin family PIN domain ribonuclease [Candidatus Poribacteria bacterium]
MGPFFIDTNIPMYAGGTDHPLREPSRRVIMAVATGQIEGVTDAEVFQEILHRYLHIGEQEKGFRIFDLFYRIMSGNILPVEDEDVLLARELAERYTGLSPRDLIHLAVMMRHRITLIISADRGFDLVEGIERIDPTDFEPPFSS